MYVFFFKQMTAYDMRVSDWSSDVCSSDLSRTARIVRDRAHRIVRQDERRAIALLPRGDVRDRRALQRHHTVSLGADHRFPQAALCPHPARGYRLMAR